MLNKLVLLLATVWFVSAGTWAHAAGPVNAPAGSPGQGIEVRTIDLAIIAAYLVGIVALGCWAGLRRKREAKGSDYFLAGKSLKWPMIGLALFATNISTIHLVSFAQNGYTSGLVYGNFEWMAAFTLVILSWFFAPFYIRSGVATLPDFMEKRYSRGSRDYLALLSIFSAITVHIGFSLYTGTIVLEGSVLHAFVENPAEYRFFTILAICGATALYTIIGGLLAVVLTESIQTVVLLTGATSITILGLFMMGGWDGSWGGLVHVDQLSEGWRQVKQNVHPGNLSMIRPDTDPTGISWYAVLLGYPVLGIWYWCTDQTIVQRVLGAKDENHARIGPIFAGFIKILPVLIFVVPGVICLALVNAGEIDGLPMLADGSPDTEKTYSHLIAHVLPAGVRGVVVAALLAALMSTVSGALNSIATLCSYDIYKRFKPQADDRHLIRVGRLATFVAMCVAVAWTLGIGGQKSIFQMMVDVFPVVAPPTAVVFVWGVFWKRASSAASLITLIGGSIVGLGFFIVNFKKLNYVGDYEINALLQAFILFVLESVALVILSFVFPHKHTAESESLVWKSPLEALRSEGAWRGLGDYRVLSILLVVVMVGFYVWFSGEDTYYSVNGQVTLSDGTPVVGAEVVLETDDPRFNATAVTDAEGQYAYGAAGALGGAPAGTEYRIRIVPFATDYVVQLKDDAAGEVGKTLAAVPPGTDVGERTMDVEHRVLGLFRTTRKKRVLVVKTMPQTEVPIELGKSWSFRRATGVPAKYADFGTSGLTCTVEAVPVFTIKRKRYDFRLQM